MTTMYHTTPYKNWEKIRRGGLAPAELDPEVQRVTGLRKGIYLEKEKDMAYDWAIMLASLYLEPEIEYLKMDFAIIEVSLPESAVLSLDPQVIEIGPGERAPTAFITPDCLPPEELRLVDVTTAEVG